MKVQSTGRAVKALKLGFSEQKVRNTEEHSLRPCSLESHTTFIVIVVIVYRTLPLQPNWMADLLCGPESAKNEWQTTDFPLLEAVKTCLASYVIVLWHEALGGLGEARLGITLGWAQRL